MLYSFNTSLLSAAKTGTPNLINTSLSGTGYTFLSGDSVVVANLNVGIVSLSTTDVGIAFTPISTSIGSTFQTASAFELSAYNANVTVNVYGSVFNIPAILTGSQMALVNTDNTYTVFTFLSGETVVPLSAFSETISVSTPNSRRLRYLGY